MSDDKSSGDFSGQALLVRLDERVHGITKVLDRHDERINEFADAMSQTAISLRDVVAMQKLLDGRMDTFETEKKERQNQDARITQQKLVLVGTMFASLIALLTAVITAWIQVTS